MILKKAFTLMEIIVVLIIVGILVAIMLPSLFNNVEQTRAQTAENNLMAIEVAQSKYSEDYASTCVTNGYTSCYCSNTSSSPGGATCGTSQGNLGTNLKLSMSTDSNFTYTCTASVSPYQCTATATDGSGITLTLNPASTPALSCTPTGSSQCPSDLQ